jgi:transcriptional regulator with XRE-family HTH domain
MFSDRLKDLREDNDLTQSELAKILNISREAISGYENTGKEPNFDILVRIADYFDVSLDYLLSRTNTKVPFKKK